MSIKTPFLFREGLNKLASHKNELFTLMHRCVSPPSDLFSIPSVHLGGPIRHISFMCEQCHNHAMKIAVGSVVNGSRQDACGHHNNEFTVITFDMKRQELILRCPNCQRCQGKFAVLGVSDN